MRQFGLIESGWVADSAEADLLFVRVIMRSGAPSTTFGEDGTATMGFQEFCDALVEIARRSGDGGCGGAGGGDDDDDDDDDDVAPRLLALLDSLPLTPIAIETVAARPTGGLSRSDTTSHISGGACAPPLSEARANIRILPQS